MGSRLIKALVDSGATINLISSKVVRRLGILIVPIEPLLITLANSKDEFLQGYVYVIATIKGV